MQSVRSRSSTTQAKDPEPSPRIKDDDDTRTELPSSPTAPQPPSPFNIDKSTKRLWGYLDIGSEVIENKGPVARDHMANERTFLSWMRTSLALSTAGVGVTQLFKIATEKESDGTRGEFLLSVGKPLGATFVAIAIYCIIMGLYRFFNTQSHLKDGNYPAARFSVGFLVFLMLSISIVTLVSVLYADRKS